MHLPELKDEPEEEGDQDWGLRGSGGWRQLPSRGNYRAREIDKRIPAPRTFQSTSHLLAATAGKCGDALAIRAAGHKTHISSRFFPTYICSLGFYNNTFQQRLHDKQDVAITNTQTIHPGRHFTVVKSQAPNSSPKASEHWKEGRRREEMGERMWG